MQGIISARPEELRQRRAALIIAHPGHELWVHHWLELARPLARTIRP